MEKEPVEEQNKEELEEKKEETVETTEDEPITAEPVVEETPKEEPEKKVEEEAKEEETEVEPETTEIKEPEVELVKEVSALRKKKLEADAEAEKETIEDEPSSPTNTVSTESATQIENKYELLDEAFRFLQTEEELNPLLCGYFNKLVTGLLKYKRVQTSNYIFDTPGLLEWFVKHIYDKSLSDLMVTLLKESESNSRCIDAVKLICERLV